jgi:carboxyl-terminal processing protease
VNLSISLLLSGALVLVSSFSFQPTAAAEPLQSATEQQLQAVQQAFELLLDRFVQPLSPPVLLDAAWDELTREAAEHQAPDPGPAPGFADDPDTASATFRSALRDYLAGSSTRAGEEFVPAHAAIRGMAAAVHEGHTYFLDPKHYAEYQAWSSGQVTYGGIGARFKGPGLVVIDVDDPGPAIRAGLRPGDEVLQVDGKPVAGLLPEPAADLIRGPVGTSVELLVQRRGEPAPSLLRLNRERIVLDFVVARQIGDIGYLLLRGFPEPTVIDRVEQELAAFDQYGARGVIVDVRSNTGGRLDLGERLLSDFLPADTDLYQVLDRTGDHQTRAAAGHPLVSLPLAVLIDQRTQSMAEIFAAALHEQAGATLLGHTSAGNVAGGRLFPLQDGSALDVTTFEIRSATGGVLNGVGVVPDEPLDGDRATTPHGTDPLIDRAVQLLEGQS